jgi:Cu(I)/Ag(I) efflux system membrane protein CusA/SilA
MVIYNNPRFRFFTGIQVFCPPIFGQHILNAKYFQNIVVGFEKKQKNMNTKSITKTMIVLLAVPFSAVGAVWFLYLLGYNMSVAVWVGLIALLGVDAETGVFMLLYLDLAYEKAKREGRLRNISELRQAILEGAVKRLRPKLMTVATMFIGLIPIMWSSGTGADVMKRIAAPMIGGIFTSFMLELLVYPAIYEIWKWHFEVKKSSGNQRPPAELGV